MKQFDRVLALAALLAAFGCNRMFSLSSSEAAVAAPVVQQQSTADEVVGDWQVYLPVVETMPAEPLVWQCPCPVIDGVCRCVPGAEQAPEPTCRPPCWLVDGICHCVAGPVIAGHKVYLPVVERPRPYCPGVWIGNCCVIGP